MLSRAFGGRLATSSLRHGVRSFGGLANQVEFQKSVNNDKPFDRILIANRGEIAVRIIRTCRRLGIETVAIHSEADAASLAVDMADFSVCVGPPATAESYLQIERIVDAVKMTGAQAVHPGFGFLSENTLFAAALEDNDIKFVGPKSKAIRIMGDKITSKQAAIDAKINVIPGDNRVVTTPEDAISVAKKLGYPVMVKASAGGGGKGMRIARSDAECREAFRLSTNESKSAFGDDRLFVEKFIEDPRHVEIQVLADEHGNVVYLNERECSIQRRNQKVYEEAPSPVSTPELRAEMGRQACQIARAVDYVSAGTCEFLVGADLSFYFLEMNTRLQVEHPITEAITGVDLVEQMLNVAAGRPLPFKQEDIGINGWAFEARVYAEDPFREFLPQTGTLTKYREPNFPNVRVDSGIREYAEISTHYDPMISKLVTWGPTREEAMNTMRGALDSYVIHGLNHNIPFLRSILDHPRFQRGELTTGFIQEEYPDGFDEKYLTLTEKDVDILVGAAARAYRTLRRELSGKEDVHLKVIFKDVSHDVIVHDDNHITHNGHRIPFDTDFQRSSLVFNAKRGDDTAIMQLIGKNTHDLTLQMRGIKHVVSVRTPEEDALYEHMPVPEVIDEGSILIAPMPGNIFSLSVKEGDTVGAGQEVCVIEAMKMQNVFTAMRDGVVKKVYVKEGDAVQADQKIFELE